MNRFLRTTAILLALLLIASVFSSCKLADRFKFHMTDDDDRSARGIPEDNDLEYVRLNPGGYTYSPHYTPLHPLHSYSQLSDGQKALYDELIDNVREVYPDTEVDEDLYKTKQVIVEDYILSMADIRVAAKALYDDNPDLFWLSGTIYQLTDKDAGYTAVQMRSIYSPMEIKEMQEKLRIVIDMFYENVPDGLSAYEREKYVHDYIINICEYDKDAAATHSTDRVAEAYIIYGTLIEHKAVCEGYARTMQLLLNGLGVDCVGITGIGTDSDGSEELHMWDAVNLEGDWYYVDPTWDDQTYDYRCYRYFNLNEEIMSRDHQNSKSLSELSEDEINGSETFSSVSMNIFVPECSADIYCYYQLECPCLSDYEGGEVVDALYRAALDQKDYLTVYIDPDSLDFDNALEALFQDSPQYFFSYVEEVNGWLSSYEIDNSNLTYYTDPERSAVTVILKYY